MNLSHVRRRRVAVHPLLLMGLLVLTSLLIVHALDDDTVSNRLDPITLTIIILAYLMAVTVMVTRTGLRAWTFLGAGMAATFTADAMLYIFLMSPKVPWDFPVGDVVEPTIRSGLWLDMVRSLLLVGGPFIVVGLLREWRVERRERHEDVTTGA